MIVYWDLHWDSLILGNYHAMLDEETCCRHSVWLNGGSKNQGNQKVAIILTTCYVIPLPQLLSLGNSTLNPKPRFRV